MKDAFGRELQVEDKVLYCNHGSNYCIGQIIKLYPKKDSKKKYYTSFDKIQVEVLEGSKYILDKNPIIRAFNVVKLPVICNVISVP